ncbi:hypothetical protein [Glutamicibacter endophyticus]|uniref:hypothetical protein n=1 Tax=Glutamicibacter endophyticus TaxID=1522174 RepID=UPI003AF13E2D
MVHVALTAALVLFAVLGIFQVLVALGLPYGRFVWGGQHRRLPPKLRVGSLIAVLLYVGFAALLSSRAGVLPGGESPVVRVLTWVLFAYLVIGVGMNAISRSPSERWTMTPTTVVLALATLVIALN